MVDSKSIKKILLDYSAKIKCRSEMISIARHLVICSRMRAEILIKKIQSSQRKTKLKNVSEVVELDVLPEQPDILYLTATRLKSVPTTKWRNGKFDNSAAIRQTVRGRNRSVTFILAWQGRWRNSRAFHCLRRDIITLYYKKMYK